LAVWALGGFVFLAIHGRLRLANFFVAPVPEFDFLGFLAFAAARLALFVGARRRRFAIISLGWDAH